MLCQITFVFYQFEQQRLAPWTGRVCVEVSLHDDWAEQLELERAAAILILIKLHNSILVHDVIKWLSANFGQNGLGELSSNTCDQQRRETDECGGECFWEEGTSGWLKQFDCGFCR